MQKTKKKRGPCPPPEGPGYSETCGCGSGREARTYLVWDNEWICYDCTEDRRTGGFGGRDTGASTLRHPLTKHPATWRRQGACALRTEKTQPQDLVPKM